MKQALLAVAALLLAAGVASARPKNERTFEGTIVHCGTSNFYHEAVPSCEVSMTVGSSDSLDDGGEKHEAIYIITAISFHSIYGEMPQFPREGKTPLTEGSKVTFTLYGGSWYSATCARNSWGHVYYAVRTKYTDEKGKEKDEIHLLKKKGS